MNHSLIETHFNHVNQLAEELYVCWHNSFCFITRQLDQTKLRSQVHSYGIFEYDESNKKLPSSFRNKMKFKTLTWVNQFIDAKAEIVLNSYTELNKLMMTEIRKQLFSFVTEEDKITYANIILCAIDKTHIHNMPVDRELLDFRHKELFECVLNQKFMAEDDLEGIFDTSYDLSVRLIYHFDFIDKLIELFKCFHIDLLTLAEKMNCSLYIFDRINNSPNIECDIPSESDQKTIINENISLEQDIIPRFNTLLSEETLISIMHYLIKRNFMNQCSSDLWLYWFDLKIVKFPQRMKWKGSPTMLSNIIQHLCGEGKGVATTIKAAFGMEVYVKPTRSAYELQKTYKEIERIITIFKQI
jgi:hypothetical protein